MNFFKVLAALQQMFLDLQNSFKDMGLRAVFSFEV